MAQPPATHNVYPAEMLAVELDIDKWVHLFFNLQMQGGNWPFIDFDLKILSNKPGMFVEQMLIDRHGRIKDLTISRDATLETNLLC